MMLVDEDPPTSVYQSAWISWGSYVLKKKVLFVDLLVPTTGDWQVTIQTAKDQREVWTDAPTYRLQPPDSDDLPVWDTAVWDTAVWERAGMTAIRYAVAIQSCTTFAWKIETTADVILVGAAIDYTAAGTKILQGKV